MFCPQCGTELRDDGRFCENCGTPIPTVLAGTTTPTGSTIPTGPTAPTIRTGFTAPTGTPVPTEEPATPTIRSLKRVVEGASSLVDERRRFEHKDFEIPSDPIKYLLEDKKCVPAFVVGLVAGLFGIMGGYCVTACTSFSSSASNASFFMIFLSSIVGLIGACLCFRKARLGSCMMLIPTVSILIKAFFMYGGAEMMSIFAMILFGIASIVGFLMTR